MTDNYLIRPEKEKDYREVENMIRESFWNVYSPGCSEHYIVNQFRNRQDFISDLDFVIEVKGRIIGHIMYSKGEIKTDDNKIVPTATLGPISIAPNYKRQGYGTILCEYSMKKAKEYGIGAIALVGNIDFYGNLGFVQGKSIGIKYAKDPGLEFFLVKELDNNFLKGITGTYKDSEGYLVNDKYVEIFDLQFPPKQKLKLPWHIF